MPVVFLAHDIAGQCTHKQRSEVFASRFGVSDCEIERLSGFLQGDGFALHQQFLVEKTILQRKINGIIAKTLNIVQKILLRFHHRCFTIYIIAQNQRGANAVIGIFQHTVRVFAEYGKVQIFNPI